MEEVDWDKPIQTRDGRPARYLGKLNTINDFNRLVAIKNMQDSYEHSAHRDENGKAYYTKDSAIINIPEEYWVNVYEGNKLLPNKYTGAIPGKFIGDVIYDSEQAAKKAATSPYIKSIKIEL